MVSSQSTYGTGHLDLLSATKLSASPTMLILANARHRNRKYIEIKVRAPRQSYDDEKNSPVEEVQNSR